MINPNKISVKTKLIITTSVIWTVVSFIISLGIASDNDSGYFLENILTFLTSFLMLTAPAWIYWSSFWIWGDGVHNALKNIFTKLARKFGTLNKNKGLLLRKISYALILIVSMIIAGSVTKLIVKDLFVDRRFEKLATTKLEELGATEAEVKNLLPKIKKYKGDFDKLWDEKDFRSIALKNTVSEINKATPTKIDEITQLTEASTDGDRALSYKYKVDLNYYEAAKIYYKIQNSLHRDRKKYWCHDNRAADYRKMRSIIEYVYFDKEMKLIGRFSLNIEKDCQKDYSSIVEEVYRESEDSKGRF